MEALVSDPRENIYAEPGDVLTVVKAPRSFTVFGATGQNNEIAFPAATLSLAEALAKARRIAGRAAPTPAGVFLFRYEPVASVLQLLGVQPARHITPDGEGRGDLPAQFAGCQGLFCRRATQCRTRMSSMLPTPIWMNCRNSSG